jgi:hypothetical protein
MNSRRRRQKNTIQRQLLDVAKRLTVNLEARIRKGLKGDTVPLSECVPGGV